MARAADDEGAELAVAARLAMVEILAGDPDGGLAALTRSPTMRAPPGTRRPA